MSELTLFDHQATELKESIKELLIRFPDARDNDNLLVTLVWEKDVNNCQELVGSLTSIRKFFKLLADPNNSGKITSYKSIVRYRAMLQAEFPELQGRTYRKRKEDGSQLRKEFASSME